ncbi:hypothetical protein A2U01_0084773, partial [Trifolium medium]|nr:hypothetical protein [Trifolium medium]
MDEDDSDGGGDWSRERVRETPEKVRE